MPWVRSNFLLWPIAPWRSAAYRAWQSSAHAPQQGDAQMESEKKFHPYLPWKTFFNLLLQMEERGLPARIDRSYLQGRSGADQSYLISTLKSFGLIGAEGEVLDPLRELVQDKEGRQGRIAGLLQENYPEVIALAPNATQQQ